MKPAPNRPWTLLGRRFLQKSALINSSDTANDIERDATRGTGILKQVELAVANRIVRLVTIIADSAQHQAIDTIFSCDMGNRRALHADTIGMRRLDSVGAHGSARHKTVARGNRTDKNCFAPSFEAAAFVEALTKPRSASTSAAISTSARRRAKLLKPRCRLGDKRGIGIQIAQALANDDIVNMELGIQATCDTRKHNCLWSILANEVLRRSSGVHRAHARRCGDKRQAVELTAHNGQACLLCLRKRRSALP